MKHTAHCMLVVGLIAVLLTLGIDAYTGLFRPSDERRALFFVLTAPTHADDTWNAGDTWNGYWFYLINVILSHAFCLHKDSVTRWPGLVAVTGVPDCRTQHGHALAST